MKQLSAFPDERPDLEVKEKHPPFKGLRRRLELYLKKTALMLFVSASKRFRQTNQSVKNLTLQQKMLLQWVMKYSQHLPVTPKLLKVS